MNLEEPRAEQEALDSPNKKKGVRFHSRNSIEEVQRISTLSQYSLDEIQAVWGDSDEFKLRKKELKETVIAIRDGKKRESSNFHSNLGTAGMFGEGNRLKKESRKKAWETVMDEQDLQYQEGKIDDELLADVYHVATQFPGRRAQEDALKIHEEVERSNVD
jgi:hypothetical protein